MWRRLCDDGQGWLFLRFFLFWNLHLITCICIFIFVYIFVHKVRTVNSPFHLSSLQMDKYSFVLFILLRFSTFLIIYFCTCTINTQLSFLVYICVSYYFVVYRIDILLIILSFLFHYLFLYFLIISLIYFFLALKWGGLHVARAGQRWLVSCLHESSCYQPLVS